METPYPATAGFLAWSAEFELGVPEIDSQHRRLLGFVNAFASAFTAGGGDEALRALLLDAGTHFDFEEALMQRVGYERGALHAEQHAELLAAMERLQGRLVHRPGAAEHRKTLDFLRDWFAIHIVMTDADLARHLKALKLAHLPV